MSPSTTLQSCNHGNRRGIATETAELLHSMLVFYTFTIKSLSTVKLMHPQWVKMELWKRAKGCYRGWGGWGLSVRKPKGGWHETSFLRREAELNLKQDEEPRLELLPGLGPHLPMNPGWYSIWEGGEDRRSSRKEIESINEDRWTDATKSARFLHSIVTPLKSQ